MKKNLQFKIEKDCEKERLDVYLAKKLTNMSRSYIKKNIIEENIKVNAIAVKPNYRLRENDIITFNVPKKTDQIIKPENIPLDIIYEDKDILVVNKPRSMVVHPAPRHYSNTLVNALLAHTNNLSFKKSNRPGIVHRLDKDTSGLIVVAKNDSAHINIVKQLKQRQIKRIYLALTFGNIVEDKGTIDAPIGRHPVNRKKMSVVPVNSKHAITHFTVLERFSNYTLLEVDIETGRTHQIRVHLSYIGYPIVGDPVYSRKKNPFAIQGQALHAYKLGFCHPTSRQYMKFNAPIPDDFNEILKNLRKERIECKKKLV